MNENEILRDVSNAGLNIRKVTVSDTTKGEKNQGQPSVCLFV